MLAAGSAKNRLSGLAGLLVAGATLLLLIWRKVYTSRHAGLPLEDLVPRAVVRKVLGWTAPALVPERTAILAVIVLAATGFIFRAFGYNLKDVPYVGSVHVVMFGGRSGSWPGHLTTSSSAGGQGGSERVASLLQLD